MISKPGKDHVQLKGWRPVNLINCICKLGEKVVADELPEAGLLHRHQFGSIKGRSAIEPVFREVVRAQRALAKGGRVACGMWDVQGGFQNVKQEAVIQRCQQNAKAKRWTGYLRDFFRAREFTIEWDGNVRGTGKTNVGAAQGSPLSPVVFMAPILEAMENRMRTNTGLEVEVELPSYVDDILAKYGPGFRLCQHHC